MKKIYDFYLLIYRAFGFIFLIGIIISAFFYAFSLVFFVFNKSWAIPIVLSPSQKEVLSYRAQSINLLNKLDENKIKLLNAEEKLKRNVKLLDSSRVLKNRILATMNNQSKRYLNEKKKIEKITVNQNENIQKNKKVQEQLKNINSTLNEELENGLITKDTATVRIKELSTFDTLNTREELDLAKTKQQINELETNARTLQGDSTNFNSINPTLSLAEIDKLINDLEVENLSLEQTLISLEDSNQEAERMLNVMKDSPYYIAQEKPVSLSFTPYENIKSIKENDKVYTCYLQMIFCREAGTVEKIYSSEEYTMHPIFKTNIKGKFISINFKNKKDSESELVFIGGKPLLL